MRKYCHTCRGEFPGSHEFCPRCGVSLSDEPPGPTESGLRGKQIGPLVLEQEIQRTSRGVLYRARHTAYDKTVLARIFRPQRNLGEGVIRQMQREVELATRLTHPNILRVYELHHTDDGTFYLVMEHVEADTLDSVLREVGALEQELALAITRQVLSALDLAHSKEIVHRCLTPAQILLVHTGQPGYFVKLTEFGLSKRAEEDPEIETTKLVQNQLVHGTPWYLAPEALRGDETDRRVDIYAAGMIMFQMLTGVIPFEEADAGRLAEKVMFGKVPRLRRTRPDYPFHPALDGALARALAKQPGKRYRTAGAFHNKLAGISEQRFSTVRAIVYTLLTAALIYVLFGIRIVRNPDDSLGVRFYAPRTMSEDAASRETVVSIGLLQWSLGQLGAYEKPVDPSEIDTPLPAPTRPDGYELYEKMCAKHGQAQSQARILRGMIRIPEGPFAQGSDDPAADPDERPLRQLEMAAFHIDAHELTNREYALFIADLDREMGGRKYPVPAHWHGREPRPDDRDLPVVNVSWHDARLYAMWAGKRLPTGDEWEKAARGPEYRTWPWGDKFATHRACHRENHGEGPMPAQGPEGKDGESFYKVRHMAGNAAEWVADTYDREGLRNHRMIRGGSFRNGPHSLRTSARDAFRAEVGSPEIGFRCAYGGR